MKMTGNEKFDNIYINCRDRVLKTALHFTKREDIAEEIMQDTFMELHLNISTVNSATAEGWLLTVARNKALNWIERNTREMEHIERLEESGEEPVSRGLEEGFLEKEFNKDMGDLGREIFTELHKENEKWHEAISRVYGMGKPQKEVATEMNMSIEVLHATLYRARNWIKRKYSERYEKLSGI